jgi:hypothetical protein
MKPKSIVLVPFAAFCLIAPTAAGDRGGVRAVNKEFAIVDCGAPIEVLRLYASTVYRHPESGQLHLLLEYGNNNGYAIGEQEWEDTAHRLVDVNLQTGEMRRTKGSDGLTSSHFYHPNGKMYLFEGKTHPAACIRSCRSKTTPTSAATWPTLPITTIANRTP